MPNQLALGLTRKRAGQTRMESRDADWLRQARAYARVISEAMGSVSSDAIHRAVDDREMAAPLRPQSYGCIFRGEQWMYLGMVPTTIATGHGRRISLWRWTEEAYHAD